MGCQMAATIETIKEKAQELRAEIAEFLDSDPQDLDAETHDELCDLEEEVGAFLGEEIDEEETPE